MLVFNFLFIQVKTCSLPTLPRHRELASELGPVHAKLANRSSIAKKHPVYRCNEYQVSIVGLATYFSSTPMPCAYTRLSDVTLNLQTQYATQFLNVMRQYMDSLCSNLRSHTITSVQSNNDRVR